MRNYLLVLTIAASLAACSGGTTPSGDGGPHDGSTGTDSGHPDGSVGTDAGHPDGSTTTDGGSGTDGGTTDDGGSGTDGGTMTDGGSGADGGTTDDGGTMTDSGTGSDSGTPVDAGPGGCTSDADCTASGRMAYCHTPDGMCGGTGTCEDYDPASLCSAIVMPVCGCDGNDYGNPCEAMRAGTSVAHAGVCATTTGCMSNADCAGTEFCDTPAGMCGGTGMCASRGIGRFCVMTCAPECGCDGTSYTNACRRQQGGSALDHTGACAGDPPPCGGTTPPGCCMRPADCARGGDECVVPASGTTTTGVCKPLPTDAGCWSDGDCRDLPGTTCMGARICPCGAACLLPDHEGTCG